MALSSQISTLYTPDVPRTLRADYRMDRADRTLIDQQILGVQQHLASSLIRGQIGTNFQIANTSANIAPGDLVCAAPETALENPATTAVRKVTKAVSAALTAAGVVLGIAVTSGIPGGWVRVATDGIVGSDLTGLTSGAPGYVRASSAGRPEMVGSLSTGDVPLGYVDGYGNLSLRRERAVSAGGGGSGGYTTIKDETTSLTQRTTLRFIGNDVVAADNGSETTVTIDGGLKADGSRALTADWSVGAFHISSTVPPTSANHLTTKSYVDGLVSGLVIRSSVQALSTSNIASLSGLATTVDGFALNTDGQRVLLTGQTTASQNGAWVVHSGAWTRPTDFLAGSDAASAYFFIQQGTTYADTGWVCTSNTGSAVVGTNNLAFSQFSSAGIVVADEVTLTKTGNTIALKSGGITDTYVNAAAAIAGTKISPNFGSQDILTTGTVRLGSSLPTTGTIRLAQGSTVYGRSTGGSSAQLISWGANNADVYDVGDDAFSINIRGSSAVSLVANGVLRLNAGTDISSYVAKIQHKSTVASPRYQQETEAANTATCQPTLWAAQDGSGITSVTAGAATFRGGDATGASGTRVGGAATLRSGTGANGDGNLTLQRGSVTVAQWVNSTSDFIALGGSGGTSLPTTGAIRLAHGLLITGKNSVGSADRTLIDWGVTAANNIHVGDTNTIMVLDATSSGIGWIVRLGGTDRYTVSQSASTWYTNTANFGLSQTNPFLGQETFTNSGTANTLTVGAQDASSTGGVTAGSLVSKAGDATGASGSRTGGNATYRSGTGATADGNLFVQRGTTTMMQLVRPNGLVVGLAYSTTITSTEMPSNTGDKVLFVGNAATAPTTGNPASGTIFWSQNTTDGDGWLTKNPSGGFWSQSPQKNWHRYYRSGRVSTSSTSPGGVTIDLGSLGNGGGSVRMWVVSRDATNSSQMGCYGFSFNTLGGSLQSGSTTPTSLYGSDGSVASVALAYPGSPNIRVDITAVDAVAYTHEVLMEITFHPNAA